MVITQLADRLSRGVETVGDTISEALFEPVIRLGVTGLARAGKTVFITSLVANLLDRGRMPGLVAHAEGRISASFLQPQPDVIVPRFEYEDHYAALMGPEPRWPDSTRSVSELRLSLKVRPSGLLGGLQGPRTVHLDIIDYPGEWLLDLGLLDKTYAQWSAEVLTRLERRDQGSDYLGQVRATDVLAVRDEPRIKALAHGFTEYLHQAQRAGHHDSTPGRFLLPGDLAGSPVLTFAPVPDDPQAGRKSLLREMERRYEAYKARVVRPFFRDHFARIDRQVVLVDVLDAIHQGPRAVEDLRTAMSDILGAFRPGRNAFLNQLLMGKRVEKILFAATKADHLHHTQHGAFTAIMEALTRDARDRARFAGADTQAMAIAALRATTEEIRSHGGEELPCVRGHLLATGKPAAFYPGQLPNDPGQVLAPARDGAEHWLGAEFGMMQFAPAPVDAETGRWPASYQVGPRGAVSDRGQAVTIQLRPARALDAGRVGEILHAFETETDWMPKQHSAAEAIAFCANMIDRGWVTVAVGSDTLAAGECDLSEFDSRLRDAQGRGPGGRGAIAPRPPGPVPPHPGSTTPQFPEGVIGFLAQDGEMIQALYIHADQVGLGIGRALLDGAKDRSDRLKLWTFQANHGAQRFYLREGFREIRRSDGADNDEGLPDIQYLWERSDQ